MFFHVILTTECNLQCKYCFGEALEDIDPDFPISEIDYGLPKRISYDIGLLDKFSRQDNNCVLIFYGGEPLLRIDDIKKIMDKVKTKHFLIQTNGLLLDHLPPKYVNRLHTIIISIDGDKTLTDFYRGEGTFRRIIDNLKFIKRNGFTGELIARMTVMEQTDIYKQVTYLLGNHEFSFSSVHWQLNAGFWKNDFPRRHFKEWSEENYNPEVRRLVKYWVDHMEKKGEVLKLYPFLGVTQSFLLNEEQTLLRCGAGWINYAIQTDGYIVPCSTMWGMKNYYLGHINHTNPLKLKKIFVDSPCTQCDIFNICGGRCLYANKTRRWSPGAYNLVCKTVQNLINAIRTETHRIKKLMKNKKISQKDFEYTKYNGCEIIP